MNLVTLFLQALFRGWNRSVIIFTEIKCKKLERANAVLIAQQLDTILTGIRNAFAFFQSAFF